MQEIEQQERQPIQKLAFSAVSQKSAANYFPLRALVTACVPILLGLGKTSLPTEEVHCIEDLVLNWLSPISNYLRDHATLSITLLAVQNFLVDTQLLLITVYWFLKTDNFRLPFCLTVFGVSKMILSVLFRAREIPNTLDFQSPIPSILNAEAFEHDYFFNAQCGFMLIATLEWFLERNYKMGLLSAVCCVYSCILPLFFRQNYFMDIFTGIITAHLIHQQAQIHSDKIDRILLTPYRFVMSRLKDREILTQ